MTSASHVRPVALSCCHCNSRNTIRVKQRTRSGIIQVFDHCLGCGLNANTHRACGLYISHSVAGDIEAIPLLRDYMSMDKCEHCGDISGVEYHHYSPGYIFDDPEQWATGYLCKKCHELWHRKMGTYPYKCLCRQRGNNDNRS